MGVLRPLQKFKVKLTKTAIAGKPIEPEPAVKGLKPLFKAPTKVRKKK